MRELKLNDPLHPAGGPTIRVKNDDNCVFCKHCTDIFWDYTHGPYMIFCEKNFLPEKMTCKYFEEDTENEK